MKTYEPWLFEVPVADSLSFETPSPGMLQSPRFQSDPRLQAAANNRPPLKSGERGEAVKKLQQALIDLGLPMPVSTRRAGTPDGIYGQETAATVRQFQLRYGLTADGVTGKQTLQKLDQLFRQAPPTIPPSVPPTIPPNTPPTVPPNIPPTQNRIEDRTAFSPKEKRKGKRNLKQIYALVLHQMAFSRGNEVKKYDTVTAHFIITPDGKIAQLHPVSDLLWSSNGFNQHSVAVEFAGNFPNTQGKCWSPKTHGCHAVTPAQIEAGRYLIRHLIQTIGLTHVLAHRQSSPSRENDPGPDIWYHVCQWAVDNLKLRDGGPGFKVGKGNPIPDVWRTWGRRRPPMSPPPVNPPQPTPPPTATKSCNPFQIEFERAASQVGVPSLWATSASLCQLIKHESRWNPAAKNPSSTAFGLFQFLKSTWKTHLPEVPYGSQDPTWQAVGGFRYIKAAYRTPERAWAFWQATAQRNPLLAPPDLRAKATQWIAKGYRGY